MTAPALTVRGLGKRYGGRTVLEGADLDVDAGELVALLGPSGSGKTTLFSCLTRLVEPDAGRVVVAGRAITGTRGRALAAARRDIGTVFQQYNVATRLTALDNVLAGRLTHHPTWRAVLRCFPTADRALAVSHLEEVGLGSQAGQPAGTLSGGQQQRVAIARALTQQPRLLLADEPVASLDPATAEGILSALYRIATTDGVAVLCSLHQEHLAHRYATRVLRLEDGRVTATGQPPRQEERSAAAARWHGQPG